MQEPARGALPVSGRHDETHHVRRPDHVRGVHGLATPAVHVQRCNEPKFPEYRARLSQVTTTAFL